MAERQAAEAGRLMAHRRIPGPVGIGSGPGGRVTIGQTEDSEK